MLLDEAELFNPYIPTEKSAGRLVAPTDTWSLKGSVKIGYLTAVNGPLKIRGRVRIGRFCAFGQNIGLIEASHDPQLINHQLRLQRVLGLAGRGVSKGPIEIGHAVWIGDDAKVLGNVTVGHGAVIGAGSVVTKDVEPFSIVAGYPARHIRYRFAESVRSQLLELAWWDWDLERMKRNLELFSLHIEPEEEVDLSRFMVDAPIDARAPREVSSPT